MGAPYQRTRWPGIFKRGSRYVVTVRIAGKKRERTTRTLEEARALKASWLADRDRGDLRAESRTPFGDYAREWIDRYRGNGRRGFTEESRAVYRRDLEARVIPFFSGQLGRRLEQITPTDVDRFVGWLADPRAQGRPLSDATIRRILTALRSCLATARREGLIRANPADRAVLPVRDRITDDDDEGTRVFSREQLDTVLRVVHPRHRALFQLLAGTGLRWGEAAALRRGDLVLDGSAPVVKVRRSVTKAGRFKGPKSRHGRRDVPLAPELVHILRAHLAALPPGDADALAFPSPRGHVLDYSNTRRAVLRPAIEEAGAGWAAFHTLRHTFASMLIERGTSIVQVSRLLGHHSPAFTLQRYAHLVPGDEAAALDLSAELEGAASAGTLDPGDPGTLEPAEVAGRSG